MPSTHGMTDSEQQKYTASVVLLGERLERLAYNFHSRADEVIIEHEGRNHFEAIEAMSEGYTRLAQFSNLLAESIKLNAAEISETNVSFGKNAPLSKDLKKYLKQGLDKKLMYEIKELAGNHYDGDAANLATQVELYIEKLRERHDLLGPENDNSPKPRWR